MNDQHAESAPILDIAIPVNNEERVLERSVRALHAHVRARIPFPTRLTIVDNASDDGTRLLGMRLATELEGVRFMHLAEKGRGVLRMRRHAHFARSGLRAHAVQPQEVR